MTFARYANRDFKYEQAEEAILAVQDKKPTWESVLSH